MNHTRPHPIEPRFGLVCASLLLVFTPRLGHTGPHRTPSMNNGPWGANVGQCLAVPVVDVLIPDRGGSFHVYISPVFPTVVRFPDEIDLGDSLTTYDNFQVSQFENTIVIKPTIQLPESLKTNIHLITNKVETTMNLSVADPPAAMSSLVMVTPVPAAEYETRKIEAEKKLLEHDAERKRAYRKSIALTLLELKQLLTEYPPAAALGIPAGMSKRRYAREGDTVAVITWAVSVRGERYLKVTIDNQTDSRIELENAWLLESKRYGEKVEFVPARGTVTADERIAIVPPRERAIGMVLIPEHIKSPLDALKVQFLGPAAMPTLVATQIVELYPMPPDERRRRRQAKQVAVSVRAVGGALWLRDGANLDMVDGAPISGLGVRVSKGMHRNFAFEADIAGGVSGDMRFNDVTWGAMQGDIVRDAQFGRFLIGGQLRFGDKYTPHARFGLGVQVVQHSSQFMPDAGGEQDGPDDGVALDLLWSVGVGMTIRIKEHWVAGLEISGLRFVQAFNSDTLRGGFEAGLYLGYGWNP